MQSGGQRPRPKTGCWIAALIAMGVTVCCCGGVGLLGFRLFKTQQDGVFYADRFLRSPAFMKWDLDALLAETGPEYREPGVSDSEMRSKTEKVLAVLRKKLGLPLEFGTTTGIVNNSFQGYAGVGGPNGSVGTMVRTSTPTRFEKGRGTIQLTLFKEDGWWKIGRFYVTFDK